MKIKVIKFDNYKAPNRAHYNDSGADIFAAKTMDLEPGKITKVPTGIGIELPNRAACYKTGYLCRICRQPWRRKRIWSLWLNRNLKIIHKLPSWVCYI